MPSSSALDRCVFGTQHKLRLVHQQQQQQQQQTRKRKVHKSCAKSRSSLHLNWLRRFFFPSSFFERIKSRKTARYQLRGKRVMHSLLKARQGRQQQQQQSAAWNWNANWCLYFWRGANKAAWVGGRAAECVTILFRDFDLWPDEGLFDPFERKQNGFLFSLSFSFDYLIIVLFSTQDNNSKHLFSLLHCK